MEHVEVGFRFGRWTVVQAMPRVGDAKSVWRCACDCGNYGDVQGHQLTKGRSRSCGCIRRDATLNSAWRHGMRYSAEYSAWIHMRRRCNDPRDSVYAYYGGRGIQVCESWNSSFERFLSDMGPRPSPLHSIDRYPDNDGNYEPGNCRWATREQQNNNKRDNVLVKHDGLELTASQWARRLGYSLTPIRDRIFAGMSIADILADPPERRYYRRKNSSPVVEVKR